MKGWNTISWSFGSDDFPLQMGDFWVPAVHYQGCRTSPFINRSCETNSLRNIMSLDKDHQIYKPILLTSWTCCWDIIRQYPGSHESRYFNHPEWWRILFSRGLPSAKYLRNWWRCFPWPSRACANPLMVTSHARNSDFFRGEWGETLKHGIQTCPTSGFWLIEIPMVSGSSVVLPYFWGRLLGGTGDDVIRRNSRDFAK